MRSGGLPGTRNKCRVPPKCCGDGGGGGGGSGGGGGGGGGGSALPFSFGLLVAKLIYFLCASDLFP